MIDLSSQSSKLGILPNNSSYRHGRTRLYLSTLLPKFPLQQVCSLSLASQQIYIFSVFAFSAGILLTRPLTLARVHTLTRSRSEARTESVDWAVACGRYSTVRLPGTINMNDAAQELVPTRFVWPYGGRQARFALRPIS